MDRQTLVLDSEVVAFVAAPGTDAITKNMGSSEDNNAAVARTSLWPGLRRIWAGKVLTGSESQFDHARFLSYEARPKWLAQLFKAVKKCVTLGRRGQSRESAGLSIAWTGQTDFIEHDARK